jgi:MFS family permease
MIAYAQIVSIIGSGLLATQTTAYLGDTSKAGWLSTIVTIFTLALNPIVSQAADYWGRKSFITVFSLVGGFAGPMIISRAHSVTTLISGFCVLGLAFGSQALTFTVASEVISRRYRAVGQATLTASSALGGISATLAGSALITHSETYRTFWYIVAGLYLFGALGVAVGYNPPPRLLERSLRQRQKIACLDWMGTALLTAGLTLFCVALQWSGNPYPWSDPHILAPFILAVTLLLLFIAYERRFKKDGILHHGLFQHRNLLIALVAMFIDGVSFF